MRDGGSPPVRRIAIGGTSGCGKTTLARRVSARLDVPHVEMDALYHGENWTPRPSFVVDCLTLLSTDGAWVTDSFGYPAVRDEVWARADILVWLDFPRRVIMPRIVWRTVSRWLLRRELWNGNRERARDWLQPEHPMRWSWDYWKDRRPATEERWNDPCWMAIRVRLRHPREAAEWLTSLPTAASR